MTKTKLWIGAAAAAALMLLAGGCLSIQVTGNVDNPERYFRRAYSQIKSLDENCPRREGPVHSLHLLAYDRAERKLIRIGVPMWLVNACLRAGKEAAASDSADFEFERRYEIAWKSIRDLEKVGPGLLVEVAGDEERILIWLK